MFTHKDFNVSEALAKDKAQAYMADFIHPLR